MPSCMALCSPLGPARMGLPLKQTETEIVSILAPRRWDAFPRDALLASKRGAGAGNSLGLSTLVLQPLRLPSLFLTLDRTQVC